MSTSVSGVVIVGAGGHAKVVIEIFRACGTTIAGCIDEAAREPVLGVPLLGGDSVLASLAAAGASRAFVAVGDNALRKRLTERVVSAGFALERAISPRANVSPSAVLDAGVAVMAGATINALAVVGTGAIVNTNASVDHDCSVGAFAHCAPGVNLAGCVTVGEGAFLGVGVTAIPGVRVGEWTIVGAGAAIVDDLPARTTSRGVPARVVSG